MIKNKRSLEILSDHRLENGLESFLLHAADIHKIFLLLYKKIYN